MHSKVDKHSKKVLKEDVKACLNRMREREEEVKKIFLLYTQAKAVDRELSAEE